MQLDYQLSGYTFNGVPLTGAIFHISRMEFDDTGHATISVEIYANATELASGSPLATAQYGFAPSNQTLEAQLANQVFAILQAHPDAGPILAGATAVPNE